jgi:geranylgeranyl diphosphate synthase type I
MNTKSIEKTAKTVNRYLLSKLDGNPPSLYTAASYLIESGGKRLRPYMVIKSCQLLGGKTNMALQAASAVEMIHNFSLVHDDIMDNDEIRHGMPTTHNTFGTPLAILAGDVLFSKAYQIISDSNMLSPTIKSKLVSRLAKGCIDICEGQQMDISMAQSKKFPAQSQYIQMIQKKTAALFEVSCAMGAICANATPKTISNLSTFGRNLGIAFQITDDLIGVMGDSKVTKKPVGNDLREGKKSLPILLAINKTKGQDKKTILKCFGNPKASKNDLKSATTILKDSGIEHLVRDYANKYTKRAKESLERHNRPKSITPKKELASLLDFVVERSL